ncbi:MAG: hypothetical protein RMK20_16965, partial [Verrucomicrobiales bacterium]|nr:hypothetical protein [Verrucomicrobiales bacterium]
MKTNPITGAALALALFSTLNPQLSTCQAQGTAFTYQGRLDSGGLPANGSFDLRFSIFDAASGGVLVAGPLTNSATAVSNGLFTVALDFGAGPFSGAARWLEIAVRTNGGGAFTTLSPRQPILPAPYAIRAANAGTAASATSVAVGAVATAGLQDGSVTSAKIADGTITAADVNAGSFATTFWKTDGNAGTTPGTHFLGTTDNQPLEVRVNNQRALRLEPRPQSPNVIGGAASNSVSAGLEGATIAGGGVPLYPNRITNNYATIGGGTFHLAGGAWATIAGGRDNVALGEHSTVGGGWGNKASILGATVGGGELNTADGLRATVGGGEGNTAIGGWSTVSGGFQNTAIGNEATVGGGAFNTTSDWYATVGG